MKTGSILILALTLAACAPQATLEELEFEALQTGDWSAVERREQAMARRVTEMAQQCPVGSVEFCEERVGEMVCQCASYRDLESAFGWD